MVAKLREGFKQMRPVKLILCSLVVAWVALYSWRPLHLGYYHDDWSLYVAPFYKYKMISFSTILNEHPDRPLYAIFRWLFLQVWNGTPVSFQATALLIVSLAGIGLYYLGRVFCGYYLKSDLMPIVMPTVWFCASWTHGFTIFGSSAFTLPSLLFFIASCIHNIRYIEEGKYRDVIIYFIMVCSSLLTYQAFILSNIIFCIFIAACSYCKNPLKISYSRNIKVFALALIATSLVIYITKTHSPKSISLNASIFNYNFSKICDIILINDNLVVSAITDLLFKFAFIVLLLGYVNTANRKLCNTAILLFSIAYFGAFVSTIPYSFATYTIATQGVFSRTTLSLTFWIVLCSGILVVMFENIPTVKLRSIAYLIGYSILILHSVDNFKRTRSWISSWAVQREVIANFPAEKFEKIPCDKSVILINSPITVSKVEVFTAPWDIGSAIDVNYPTISSKCGNSDSRVFATYRNTHWNGSSLALIPKWNIPANHVYSIDYKTGTIVEIKAPY